MLTRARLLALSLLVAVAVPSVASAGSLAVLGIEAIDAPEADAVRLTDAIRQRLSGTAGIKMVPGKDYMEMKLVFGCMDDATSPTCMIQAGKALGAEKLIYGTLKAPGKNKPGKNVLSLRLLDVATGTVEKYIAAEQVGAEELTASGVNGVAARVLSTLMGIGKASITINTDPPGANVTVDDQPRGVSPVTVGDLGGGTHTVVVSKEGFGNRTETHSVRDGEAGKLELKLVPTPGTTTTTTTPGTEKNSGGGGGGKALKVVSLVAAILAVASAAIAIYTFTHYSSLQGAAHNRLVLDRANTPVGNMGWDKPSCSPPPGLLTSDTKYVSLCNEGNSYASATTGLWVVAGVFAAASVISLILGVRAKPAEKSPTAGFAPRLRLLAPVVSTSGGGIVANFEF